MMSIVFAVLIRRNDGFDKILISERGITINNRTQSIADITSIVAESIRRVRIKTDKFEELLPLGRITITIQNMGEISIEAINPLATVEKIVVWLNKMYRERDEKVLIIKESKGNKIVYTRE